jgi:hypothetical protein
MMSSPRVRAGVLWSCWLVASAVAVVAMRGEIRPLRSSGVSILRVDEINDGGTALKAIASLRGDVRFSENGVALGPGQSVEIELPSMAVAAPLERAMRLLWYRTQGTSTAITCQSRGQPVILAADAQMAGRVLSLASCDPDSPLTLIATRSATSDSVVVVLDRIEWIARRGPSSAPGVVPLLAAVILIGTAIAGIAFVGNTRGVFSIAIVATLMVAAAHSLTPAFLSGSPSADAAWRLTSLSPALVLCAFVAALGHVWAARYRASRSTITERLCVLALLGVALNLRWLALLPQLDQPLSPDAATVVRIAAGMTHPFDTFVREPFWPWLVRAAMTLWPDDSVAAVMVSFVMSLVWLAASFVFARRFFGRVWPPLAVLALLAVHPQLVESSAQAHRTELFGTELMLVAIAALAPALARSTRAVGLPVSVAAVALTQVAGLVPALGALAAAWMRRRIGVVTVVLTLLVTVAALLPHAIYTQRRFGQAFYFTRTMVPTFYRNVEFVTVRQTGCDGCPTPAEMARDSYAGRPASMAEYLFARHAPGEVIARTLQGYARVFLWPGPVLWAMLGWSSLAAYAVYLVGLAVALLTRARALLLIPLLSLNLLAFVVPLGIDLRLLLHMAPFAAMVMVVGAWTMLGWARKGNLEFPPTLTVKT